MHPPSKESSKSVVNFSNKHSDEQTKRGKNMTVFLRRTQRYAGNDIERAANVYNTTHIQS